MLTLANISNLGSLTASNSGVLQLAGAFNTATLGTITLATGGSVELTGSLNNASATLGTTADGSAYVLKGTITGGTVAGAAITPTGGTLDGVAVIGNLNLGSQALTLKNGTTFSGTASVAGGTFYLGSNLSLLGGSTLAFSGSGSSLNYTGGTPFTFTVPATTSVTRSGSGYTYFYDPVLNSGSIAISGGTVFGSANFTNQSGGAVAVSNGASYSQGTSYSFTNTSGGTASVTGSGSVLTLANLSNLGSLAANNSGVLQLAGNFATSALGNITLATGGSVELTGSLNNASTTLGTTTDGSAYVLKGTITGGTVASGAITPSGGTLDGVAVTGNLNLGSQALTLKNGTTFSGTASVTGGTFYLGSNLSLLGGSTLAFSGSGSSLNFTGGTPFTFTVPATTSVTRSGSGYTYFYDPVLNSGSIAISGGTVFGSANFTNQSGGAVAVSNGASYSQGTSYSFTNTSGGTASVTGSGSVLTLANLSNLGSLAANNSGVLQLAGNFATSALGNITLATGGSVELTGSLNNASTTLGTTTDGSAYVLKGTITGGTVASGAITPSGGTLDGVAVTGNLNLGSQALTLKNGTTFSGTASVVGGTFYLGSNLSLLGGSTLAFSGSGSSLNYTGGTPFAFSVPATASVTRSGSGYTYFYDPVTNSGSVAVTGGTIYGNANFTNQAGGNVTVSGAGSVYNFSNLTNLGSLSADTGGLISLTGSFLTSNLGNITLSTGGVVEIASGATLNNASATLGTTTNGGAYSLKGTITGGTVVGAAIAPAGGTLDGVSVVGNLAIGSQSLVLKNGATFSGTASVGNGNFYLGSNLPLLAGSTLAFSGTGGSLTYSGGTPFTLTVPATASITRSGSGYTYFYDPIANSGSVAVTGGTLYGNANFTNQTGGNVTVSGAGTIYNFSNLTNLGSVSASAGGLISLTGSFLTSNLGNITLASGGNIEIANGATLNNASATLGTTTDGGAYSLKGTITGGTIASGAIAPAGGTLDGAAVNGNLAIGSQSLVLKNGATFSGTASVGNGNFYLGSNLPLLAGSTLAFTGSGGSLTYSGGTPFTLTIPATASLTRSGAGYTYFYDPIANSGTVAVTGGTIYDNASFTNQAGGNVSVSGAGNVLSLLNLANAGSLSADTGGLLSLTGNFTTANLGAITLASGGSVEIASGATLNNASATLGTTTDGGAYSLKGTILGGNVNGAALAPTGGILDGATVTGALTIGSQSIVLKNGASFTGTASLGNGLLYLGSNLSQAAGSALSLTGSGGSLTYSGGTPFTLTIPATASITRSGAGGYTYIYDPIVNAGSFAVTGGTIFNNAAFINQSGGAVSVSSGATFTQSSGAFTQTGGVLKVDGTFNPGSAGLSVQGGSVTGSGTISGNTSFTGGTLDPGSTTGTLTFSGNLTLGATSTTLLEIGVGLSDRIAGVNNLTFGGQLNVVPLTAALTAGQSWNLFGFTTSSGSFSSISLPYTAQGWVWDTSQLQTAGLLTLTTVVPVPEPSTYVLFATGLVAMFVLHRRRK